MIIAGVDECGRGPLAGPVVAAAVILPAQCPLTGLADSKLLSRARRDQLEPQIKSHALAWAIGQASVEEIDRMNILNASLTAMRRAVLSLPLYPERVHVDGNHVPMGLESRARAIIKGDATHAEISAASILAKQFRDRVMEEYDKMYPQYGFASNKGYPTGAHIRSLGRSGICPIHRRGFRPVARLLGTCA